MLPYQHSHSSCHVLSYYKSLASESCFQVFDITWLITLVSVLAIVDGIDAWVSTLSIVLLRLRIVPFQPLLLHLVAIPFFCKDQRSKNVQSRYHTEEISPGKRQVGDCRWLNEEKNTDSPSSYSWLFRYNELTSAPHSQIAIERLAQRFDIRIIALD